MSVLDHAMGYPLAIEEKAASPLAGGMAEQGYQCGMLWGSAMAAGAESFRLYGPGPKAETAAILTSQKIVESFRACNRDKQTNCMEIIEINFKTKVPFRQILKVFIKGNIVGCFTMAGKCAKASFRDIGTILPGIQVSSPSLPVSCAALLAHKMGASEMHTVMAAGLAGGIGLSGGCCGALGTAIWLRELRHIKETTAVAKETPKTISARAEETIKNFLKASDYRFECTEITGKKFENINEHAEFLRGGGCSKIIEALATSKD